MSKVTSPDWTSQTGTQLLHATLHIAVEMKEWKNEDFSSRDTSNVAGWLVMVASLTTQDDSVSFKMSSNSWKLGAKCYWIFWLIKRMGL